MRVGCSFIVSRGPSRALGSNDWQPHALFMAWVLLTQKTNAMNAQITTRELREYKSLQRRHNLESLLCIASLVQQKRLEVGLTPAQLAKRAGLSHRLIGLVEHPKKRTDYKITDLYQIATTLECPLADLLLNQPAADPRMDELQAKVIAERRRRQAPRGTQPTTSIMPWETYHR